MSVTIKEAGVTAASATQEILTKAAESFTCQDARGRTLAVKKPSVLAQFRLVQALGDIASNQVYMRMALPLIYLAAIDGEPVIPMTRHSEVEALIQRLGDEGLDALNACLLENYGNAPDPDADKDALKK